MKMFGSGIWWGRRCVRLRIQDVQESVLGSLEASVRRHLQAGDL